jgi:hypothetical protein
MSRAPKRRGDTDLSSAETKKRCSSATDPEDISDETIRSKMLQILHTRGPLKTC